MTEIASTRTHSYTGSKLSNVTAIRQAAAGSAAPEAWDAIDHAVVEARIAGMDYESAVAAFKRTYLAHVLQDSRGNQCRAAEDLHMHRNTLNRACRDLMIVPELFRRGQRKGRRI